MEFEASKDESPIYQQYEGGDYGFDPQGDFLQFLEEARKNTSKDNYDDTTQYPEEAQNRQSDEVKKHRKSWKKSLFSWWNAGKKSNSSMVAPTSNSYIPKPKRSLSASGLVSGSGGSNSCRRQTSGPLKSVFHLTNDVEDEIPYMCLDKLDDPPRCSVLWACLLGNVVNEGLANGNSISTLKIKITRPESPQECW